MRTTLRIDDDLINEIKELAHQENISLNRLFNQTLRAGLKAAQNKGTRKRRAREKTYAMGIPRVDLDKALTLAADLEDEEILRKITLRK